MQPSRLVTHPRRPVPLPSGTQRVAELRRLVTYSAAVSCAASNPDAPGATPARGPRFRARGSSRRWPAAAASGVDCAPCAPGGTAPSRTRAGATDCARQARKTRRSAGTYTIPSDASPCIRSPPARLSTSLLAPQPHRHSAGRKTTHRRRDFSRNGEEDRPKKSRILLRQKTTRSCSPLTVSWSGLLTSGAARRFRPKHGLEVGSRVSRGRGRLAIADPTFGCVAPAEAR